MHSSYTSVYGSDHGLNPRLIIKQPLFVVFKSYRERRAGVSLAHTIVRNIPYTELVLNLTNPLKPASTSAVARLEAEFNSAPGARGG